MSESDEPLVNVVIDGKSITAPARLSTIQALWHAGYPRVKSVGCLEGVCGSCRIMVRRAGTAEVTMELGCQTLIEEGMEVSFLVFPTPTHHTYELGEINNSWEVQAHFNRIFPEADHCRHCSGCTRSCPKGIDVEKGVELASKGRFREAGELFIECVMCNFCMTACPEFIAPNHVGIFARRVTAYFHIRPSNLINRLEKLARGELQIPE
ncbi:MAG TPA: ferredoxin [Sedimenticola thiotaurini]|uniref:Ferredoxin n=1 Tax=Sedimenticola thiotaurini TaxID=1543721 RepID=A0A831W477_9GAMM|nr:ferredoxin [Sedimenticola thiotaurini]